MIRCLVRSGLCFVIVRFLLFVILRVVAASTSHGLRSLSQILRLRFAARRMTGWLAALAREDGWLAARRMTGWVVALVREDGWMAARGRTVVALAREEG